MLEASTATPVVFILKQFDGTFNLAGMIGAPKFTPERKRKYGNEREDMYGARGTAIRDAKEKWPEFAAAIHQVDSLMGTVLYLNFAYLTYVDMDQPEKFKRGDKIRPFDIGRYLPDALKIKVPRAFHPLHTLLDRMHKEAKTNPDAKAFLEQSVYPELSRFKEHFPKIFPGRYALALPHPEPSV